MFTADQLLLTTEGYRYLEDITEPVDVITEFTAEGIKEYGICQAHVRPDNRKTTTTILTRSGKSLTGDYESLWVLDTAHRESKVIRGTWQRWQNFNNTYATMSTEGVTGTIDITPDDWLFYAYGYNKDDTPVDELPTPQAERGTKDRIPFAHRRQHWPEWYWYCTLAEKVMFLRGLYDAHGRTTRRRIYLACPNDTFSRQLVVALSEFGIRASRFITEQVHWHNRPREYVVDVRNLPSIQRLSERICWYDPAMPSYRFAEIARHAHRFVTHTWFVPTATEVVQVTNSRHHRHPLYHVTVDQAHTCTINGLITRDSTQMT